MFDITISIVTHNSDLSQLKNLINQINDEKNLKIKILILDNMSNPKYFQNLLKLKCVVISAGYNLGYGKGHNLINKISENSKYQLIINPDVSLENNTLIECYKFLENNKSFVLITPTLKLNESQFYIIEKRDFSIKEMFVRRFFRDNTLGNFNKYKIRNEVVENDFISGAFMFVNREKFSEIEGFDEIFFMYFEDIDLCRRIAKIGKIGTLDYVFAYHRRSRASYRNIKMFLFHAFSFLKFKIKYYKN